MKKVLTKDIRPHPHSQQSQTRHDAEPDSVDFGECDRLACFFLVALDLSFLDGGVSCGPCGEREHCDGQEGKG